MSTLLFDEPGPKARRRSLIFSIASAVAAVALLAWMGSVLWNAGKLSPALWAAVLQPELIELLWQGLITTFETALTAMVLSVLVGAVLAFASMSRSRWLIGLVRALVELFRGLPLLLLIFFLFLGGPALGLDVSTFWALVLGLTIYNCAVFAEIFRAGIASLPRGQAEAGLSIGLSRGEVFRIILLPQATIRMLPALLSQLITILKETSLGFVIGYSELLRDARSAVEFLGGDYSLPVYTLVAVTYIIISLALSWCAERTKGML